MSHKEKARTNEKTSTSIGKGIMKGRSKNFEIYSVENKCSIFLALGMLFYPYFLIIRILYVSGFVKKLSGDPRIDE